MIDRRQQARRSIEDARIAKGDLKAICARWPYVVYARKPAPNPQALYSVLTRDKTEEDAIESAKKHQRTKQLKCLVFLEPTPSADRVMVWNDTEFKPWDLSNEWKEWP